MIEMINKAGKVLAYLAMIVAASMMYKAGYPSELILVFGITFPWVIDTIWED